MRKFHRFIPALLILVLPPAMLYPVWSNPTSAGEDDIGYYYPIRKLVAQALGEGRWPLENPYEATGVPLMADPQSAVLYPPTWLFAVLETGLAYSLSIFLAYSLAGWGAYVYLRRLCLIRPAATFGAVALMFCGFMVGHRVHLSIIQAAAMLPWGLWCVEKLRDRPGEALAWMTPVVYLAFAPGHWPTFIHMSLIWTAYLLLRAAATGARQGLTKALGRAVGVTLVGAVLALLLAGPQILTTADLLSGATRQRLGYAMAGENSYFPAAAVLWLFPMLMGSRSPNFYPQSWWGPWHLCEMLGYVGLLSLVLAVAGMWKLYRKRLGPGDSSALTPLVRLWVWIAVGALVFMLGYYLPTYRLIHMIPVLGVMRCPGRMILAVDMALATLSAITIHVLAGRGGQAAEPGATAVCPDDRRLALAAAVRRGAVRTLPLAMVAVLVLVAVLGCVWMMVWSGGGGCLAGGGRDALQAVIPTNPALWVPLILCAATAGAVLFWLRAPKDRAPVLIVLLLADLFSVTRFVDVPGAGVAAQDPESSPTGRWLQEKAKVEPPLRIWGLARNYHDRSAELLLPKTCAGFGLASISNYGPWQSPAGPHLLGLQITGQTRDWPRLIRTNYLLSLYNVRYIVTAEPRFREVIESVQVGDPRGATRLGPGEAEPNNILGDAWQLKRAELRDGVLHLKTYFELLWSQAVQEVRLEPGAVYRIVLQARAPEGAANFLRADVYLAGSGDWLTDEDLGLTIPPEQIARDWRHYEWAFRTPADPNRFAAGNLFRVFSLGERTIEVKGVALHKSRWEQPVLMPGRESFTGPVYAVRQTFPPVNHGDPSVVIYENMLCQPARLDDKPRDESRIEHLKWLRPGDTVPQSVPPLGLAARFDHKSLFYMTLPAGMIYLSFLGGLVVRGHRQRRMQQKGQTYRG